MLAHACGLPSECLPVIVAVEGVGQMLAAEGVGQEMMTYSSLVPRPPQKGWSGNLLVLKLFGFECVECRPLNDRKRLSI